MSRHRIILSIDTIAIAIVALILLIASARSDQHQPHHEKGLEHVDLR